jgi:hypothetical protein
MTTIEDLLISNLISNEKYKELKLAEIEKAKDEVIAKAKVEEARAEVFKIKAEVTKVKADLEKRKLDLQSRVLGLDPYASSSERANCWWANVKNSLLLFGLQLVRFLVLTNWELKIHPCWAMNLRFWIGLFRYLMQYRRTSKEFTLSIPLQNQLWVN